MTFSVIAHYRTTPEHSDTVAGLLEQLAEASRQEPANRSYEVFWSIDDPGHFVILEEYDDEAALDAHRASEHFERLGRGRIIPLLEQRTVREVTYRDA